MRNVFPLLFLLSCFLFASDFYRLPLMPQPPNIDGYVDENEWQFAAKFDGFSFNGILEPRRAIGFVGATEDKIYCAIVSELPKEGKILSQIKANIEKIVFDDAVEVWIDPEPDEENGVVYQMLCNSLGYAYYLAHPKGEVPTNSYYGWKGNYKIANGFHNGFWHCEIEIPIEKLSKNRKASEGRWAINLCRDFKQPWAWSCLGNNGYNPQKNILFIFSKENSLISKLTHKTDPVFGDINCSLDIQNPTERALRIKARIYLKRDSREDVKEEAINLNPQEKRSLEISLKDTSSDKFQLSVLVASPDEKEVYYSRDYSWTRASSDVKWIISREKAKPPVDFLFSYYPYLNRMRILADISALPQEARLTSLLFQIKEDKPNGKIVKEIKLKKEEFKDGKCEKIIELPPLSGKFLISAKAEGENLPKGEVIKRFERKVFSEWEHKGFGKSRKVFPPFTPIKVEGRKLFTVMKEYEINDLGLLSSVKTEDQEWRIKRELLASPMTYRAVIEGKEFASPSGKLTFREKAEDRVIGEARFSLGDLRAESLSTLDYDGTLRVDLTLFPSKSRVDSLILEIPLKGEMARMMHAMADGVRDVILSDYVPEGQGIIWDASKLMTSSFPPNFCTYIFLGNPTRGLCWFAENDKGWSWDPQKPNLQLLREGDVLKLQVNLINKPIVIEKPRTITFGILAAPVKPRLSGWRYRWFKEKFHLLGTDINWFALGDCGSVYPAGKDMYLWKMLAESNRRQLSDQEIEEVIQRGRKYFEPYGRVDAFINHVRYNLRAHLGATMVFYYNRSSYAGCEEFQTFMDEWCLNDYNPYRGEDSIYEIQIVPSESYIDYALYWFGKSFEIANNKGVYHDNYFFIPSYNTMMTSAYEKEDGTIMPSTGVWQLRELQKRIFTFMNERGMEPIVMVHNTSTQILPLYAFATVQYDWEWHYSEGDVQNRFPRKYILLVSTGELAGTWPVLLSDHGPQESDPWIQKTYIAVTLVHDLLGGVAVWVPELGKLWQTYREPFLKLAEEKGMVAYRYWDEKGQPIYAENPDLPGIVYSLPGKEALYAITSYSTKDEVAVVHIKPDVLGFKDYKVIDVDDGAEMKVENNTMRFPIKKHDLKVFRILPRG
ncbi:MAG: glycoside hydrolase domain-containing protein [bacterium]